MTVPARRADDIVAELGLAPEDIGLVWIDVQGFEAQVLESATSLLGKVPFVVEYAPYWMERAGGLDLFATLVSQSVSTVVDLRLGKRYPAEKFDEVASTYRDSGLWTDLALLP